MRFFLLLPLLFCGCSSLVYKTGLEFKEGTPRADIIAKLGPPIKSEQRTNLPLLASPWPGEVKLKDSDGRQDRYLTRRILRDQPGATGAFFFSMLFYGFGELAMFPYSIVDHLTPRRRRVVFFYDRHDRLQAYLVEPSEAYLQFAEASSAGSKLTAAPR